VSTVATRTVWSGLRLDGGGCPQNVHDRDLREDHRNARDLLSGLRVDLRVAAAVDLSQHDRSHLGFDHEIGCFRQ